MELSIDFENVSGTAVPDEDNIHRWVNAALQHLPENLQRCDVDLSVRVVDEFESQNLNHRYRQKNNPTNVLSFPSELPPDLGLPLLGDLVICAQVVEREAAEQGKSLHAHWAHMLVHGTLHLLDYDHIDDSEAEEMEELETTILTSLGFPPPYDEPDFYPFEGTPETP